MTQSQRKMTPRSFYEVAVNGLGCSRVADILKIKVRTLQRWVADPLTTCAESRSASQLERHHRLFLAMDEVGLGYACRGVIRYQKSAVDDGCCPDRIARPLPTMLEEQLADHKTLAELQTAIDNNRPLSEVRRLEVCAIEEIQRTVARYIQDRNDG